MQQFYLWTAHIQYTEDHFDREVQTQRANAQFFRNININVRCKQWRKGHLSSSWAYLPGIVGNLFEIVTVASLESVLPIELLATHRYFCSCSVSLVKTSNSIETLPFWTTVPFLTDELLFNQPMTGWGKPFASQDKFTVTTLASR